MNLQREVDPDEMLDARTVVPVQFAFFMKNVAEGPKPFGPPDSSGLAPAR